MARDVTRARELHQICHRLARVLFLARPPGWDQDSMDLALTQQVLARVLEEGEAEAQAELFLGYIFLMGPASLAPTALSHLERAAAMAAALPDGPFKANIIRDAGYLLFLGGWPELGRDCCTFAVDLAEEQGDLQGLPQTHIQLNAIYIALGQLDKAVYHALRGCSVAESTSSRTDSSMARAAVTRTLALQGRLEEAAANLDLAREYARKAAAPYVDMLVDHAEGWLRLMEGCSQGLGEIAARGYRSCLALRVLPFHRLEFGLMELWSLCADSPEIDRRLKGMEGELQRYPSLRLSADRLRARFLLASGKQGEAAGLLQKTVREACELELALEGARACEQLSETLRESDPDQSAKFREQAGVLYEEAGAHPLAVRLRTVPLAGAASKLSADRVG